MKVPYDPNYTAIIGEMIANPYYKKFTENYLNREYLKASESHYTKEEFFHGCMNAIDTLWRRFIIHLNNEIEIVKKEISQRQERIVECQNLIGGWEKEKLKFDLVEIKNQRDTWINEYLNYIEQYQIKIPALQKQLADLNEDNFVWNESFAFSQDGVSSVGVFPLTKKEIEALKKVLRDFDQTDDSYRGIKLKEKDGALINYFNDVIAYKKVMEILVTQNLVQSSTYKWIDTKKGNKGLLVAIIKQLFAQGYLKSRPTAEEIGNIITTTFNMTVSKATVNGSSHDNHGVSFIPIASTLK